MQNNKIYSLDSLRTRSLLPYDSEHNEVNPIEEHVIVSSKIDTNLKSSFKKPTTNNQKLKQIRFANPIQKIHVVENWKKFNSADDQQSSEWDCCCITF